MALMDIGGLPKIVGDTVRLAGRQGGKSYMQTERYLQTLLNTDAKARTRLLCGQFEANEAAIDFEKVKRDTMRRMIESVAMRPEELRGRTNRSIWGVDLAAGQIGPQHLASTNITLEKTMNIKTIKVSDTKHIRAAAVETYGVGGWTRNNSAYYGLQLALGPSRIEEMGVKMEKLEEDEVDIVKHTMRKVHQKLLVWLHGNNGMTLGTGHVSPDCCFDWKDEYAPALRESMREIANENMGDVIKTMAKKVGDKKLFGVYDEKAANDSAGG